MKKQGLIWSALLCIALTVAGCSGSDKKAANKEDVQVKAQYQCPMKCSETKYDKPGKCPVCGMELEKVTNS